MSDLTLAETDDETAAAGIGQFTGRLWNGARKPEAVHLPADEAARRNGGPAWPRPLLAELSRLSPDLNCT